MIFGHFGEIEKMVYFDDDASGSLKTITIIIATVTALIFGGMYFFYSNSQKSDVETPAVEPAAPNSESQPAQQVPAQPIKPGKAVHHNHV